MLQRRDFMLDKGVSDGVLLMLAIEFNLLSGKRILGRAGDAVRPFFCSLTSSRQVTNSGLRRRLLDFQAGVGAHNHRAETGH